MSKQITQEDGNGVGGKREVEQGKSQDPLHYPEASRPQLELIIARIHTITLYLTHT